MIKITLSTDSHMATANLREALEVFKANALREEAEMPSWLMRGAYNDMALWFNHFVQHTDSVKSLEMIEIVEPDGEVENGIRTK